jgi:hypothetical protein
MRRPLTRPHFVLPILLLGPVACAIAAVEEPADDFFRVDGSRYAVRAVTCLGSSSVSGGNPRYGVSADGGDLILTTSFLGSSVEPAPGAHTVVAADTPADREVTVRATPPTGSASYTATSGTVTVRYEGTRPVIEFADVPVEHSITKAITPASARYRCP